MLKIGFILIVVLILFSALFGCEDSTGIFYAIDRTPPSNEHQVTIREGVWGNVWFWRGDFQPYPVTGSITPVERQVYIFDAFDSDSAVGHGVGATGFYSEIHSPIVAITRSNRTGFYQVELSPGKYSALVKEDTLFFSSWGNDIGIGGFEVRHDTVCKVQLDIDYMAAY